MTTHTKVETRKITQNRDLSRVAWLKIGARAALGSIAAVLLVQAIALSIWPAAASFKPLDSYARSAVFTLVPALAATGLFSWFSRRMANPVPRFLRISISLLLLSFIPDFFLPDPNRTFLGSSIAAVLHLVAAVFILGGILTGYKMETKRQNWKIFLLEDQ